MRYKIRNGQIPNERAKHDREAVAQAVLLLPNNYTWSVEIKQWREKRSNAQIAYFWAGIVNPIVEETGNDKDTIHDYLCIEYWGSEVVDVFGKKKKRPVQTLTSPEPVSVENMVNFCEWCVSHMAEHGIIIEPPREVLM